MKLYLSAKKVPYGQMHEDKIFSQLYDGASRVEEGDEDDEDDEEDHSK